MLRAVQTLAVCFVLAGCSSHPSFGMFADGPEVYRGQAVPKLDTDIKLFVGEKRFSLQGETSGTSCRGRVGVTRVPALTSPGSNQCQGQAGDVVAKCTDNRSLEAQWSAVSCKVGFGEGKDTNGTAFAFTFGIPEERAIQRLEKALGISTGESMMNDTGQRR